MLQIDSPASRKHTTTEASNTSGDTYNGLQSPYEYYNSIIIIHTVGIAIRVKTFLDLIYHMEITIGHHHPVHDIGAIGALEPN